MIQRNPYHKSEPSREGPVGDPVDKPTPVERGREFASSGKRAAADGHKIVRDLQAELRERRLENTWRPKPIDDPAVLKVLAGLVRPAPPKSIRGDLVAHAFDCIQGERRVAAGLALVELRGSFARDGDWIEFVERELAEVGLARIERLIGNVAFRRATAHCVKCGIGITCQCECGKPYLPEVPWDPEPVPPEPSALERAVAAVEAAPSKSNVLIGKEIGVSEFTVRQARKKTAANIEVNIEVARMGADGRRRQLPSSKVVAPKPTTPDPNRDLMQDEADPEAITMAQRWSWSFSFHGGESIAAPAFWDRQFGSAWRELLVEPEHVAIAQQAAETWQAIAEDLAKRRRK